MDEEEWFDHKIIDDDYTKKIEDDLDTKLEQVCVEFMLYFREYATENAIPMGENLQYIDLWHFLSYNQ